MALASIFPIFPDKIVELPLSARKFS